MEASRVGAPALGLAWSASDFLDRSTPALHQFQDDFEASPQPYLIVDPRPGLRIVDANKAYGSAALVDRAKIAGEKLFDVFPDNPDDPAADGVSNLYASLQAAAATRHPHSMPVQRYDVRDENGLFVVRYWQPVNTPIFDADGRLIYLLHHVENVTDAILGATKRLGG